MRKTRHSQTARHHHTSRKEQPMQHIELRLADVGERQSRFQADRDAERSAFGRDRGSLRRQVGESLVRLGRRVGGDAMTAPAWQG
jgi:hypothetical protein